MKISGPGPISNQQSKVSSSKAGGDGSFSKMLDAASSSSETAETGSISRTAPIAFVQVIDSDEKSKKKQMVEDADDLLDELTEIRNEMLLGNLSAPRLRAIEAKLAKIEANCDDPNLNEIIEEIKIRAAVELAKLGF